MIRARSLLKVTMALVLAAVLVAAAQAQQRGRGPGMMGRSSLVGLLGMGQVREELKLTEEQTTKVRAVAEKLMEGAREQYSALRDMEDRAKRSAKMSELSDELDGKLREQLRDVLQREQMRRLYQIRMQVRAVADSLANERIANRLELTEEQKKNVADVNKEMQAKQTELFSAMRSPDASLRREAALLLARHLEPRAVSVLARALAEDPEDLRAGEELVILTCVDYRTDGLPAESWFQWWDEVDRRDPFSWFLAALERRNIGSPARAEFDLGGTLEARLFLLSLIAELPDRLLAERARRELERLHGGMLDPLPSGQAALADWVNSTRTLVAAEVAPGSAPEPDPDGSR